MNKTGGLWENECKRKFFLAGSDKELYQVNNYYSNFLIPVDALGLYELDKLKALLQEKKIEILLDSGVFGLIANYARVSGEDFNRLLAENPVKIPGYEALEEKYFWVLENLADYVWGFIELDVGGEVIKTQLRDKTMQRGFIPIPVYHPLLDSQEYGLKLVQDYDRVAIGNIARSEENVRINMIRRFCDVAGNELNCFIHLLGYGLSESFLGLYVGDSSDSSSWLSCVAFGSVRTGGYGRFVSSLGDAFIYPYGNSNLYIRSKQMSALIYNCHVQSFQCRENILEMN